jgi:hypothetical protein
MSLCNGDSSLTFYGHRLKGVQYIQCITFLNILTTVGRIVVLVVSAVIKFAEFLVMLSSDADIFRKNIGDNPILSKKTSTPRQTRVKDSSSQCRQK